MVHCSSCGREVTDETQVCSSCGGTIIDASAVDHEETKSDNNSKYNSIGGWLILVVLGRIFGVLTLPITIWSYSNLLFDCDSEIKLYIQIYLVYAVLVLLLDILLLVFILKGKCIQLCYTV